MTGRARIAGLTCLQHVWIIVHDARQPVCLTDVLAKTAGMGMTRHMIDHHLRRLYQKGAVRRTSQDRKSRRYYYRTVGEMPVDGRWEIPVLGVQDDVDEGDNWGRGGCARKTGTPADLPGIPSLAELLAR